jgi:hypothetical protein
VPLTAFKLWQVDTINEQQPINRLLQLPDAALDLVVAQLDPCSIASMAVTCSYLSRALAATISTVAVHCTQPETFESYVSWLEQHGTSLQHLTQCSVQAYKYNHKQVNAREGKSIQCPLYDTLFRHLPCPQLRQLYIGRLKLQLEQTESYPGALGSCTGLTALNLQQCELQDISAGIKAIAALPELQFLSLSLFKPYTGDFCFAELKQASQLTHLSLAYDSEEGGQHIQQVNEVSALVNLQHLALHGLPAFGVPGGLPSQLVKLTCLDVHYKGASAADQFQHLSCLTALQDLSVQSESSESSKGFPTSALSGMRHLTRLTSLELLSYALNLSISSSHTWPCLAALERLVLWECAVHQEALAGLTNLRALHLNSVRVHSPGHSSHAGKLEGLLEAISKLQLLTELRLNQDDWVVLGRWTGRCVRRDAFTALTASTNLCCIQLGLENMVEPQGECVLFRPGAVTRCTHAYAGSPCRATSAGAARMILLQNVNFHACAAAALPWRAWY